ncbi:MAG: substrate-binding domain-containing protein [Alphaproteobacteria bacterium]|nr:substrate-binding domain-containing protein [Alphaproteobacteria bacterium]
MRAFIALGVLSLMLLASPAKAEDTYVFLLKARGNPYWTAMAQGIHDTAKARGIKAIIYNTETDRAAEEQLNTCQTAIQLKPKAIILAAVTPNIAIQCFKKATKAKILVADIDANISIAMAQKKAIPMAFTVGSNNFEIGQEAAKYVTSIAGKPDPKIFVLEGAVGNVPGQMRAEGFRSQLKELLPKATIAGSLSAEWDRLKAMNIVADALQRLPGIEIIYAANDTMALGAAEAVRYANKSHLIKIIGVDGTVDARKAIRDGRLTASVAQLPYLMGKRSVELALESYHKSQTGITETTPMPVLTKEKMEANTDPLLQYVR